MEEAFISYMLDRGMTEEDANAAAMAVREMEVFMLARGRCRIA